MGENINIIKKSAALLEASREVSLESKHYVYISSQKYRINQ
jgi:hypothetical protein